MQHTGRCTGSDLKILLILSPVFFFSPSFLNTTLQCHLLFPVLFLSFSSLFHFLTSPYQVPDFFSRHESFNLSQMSHLFSPLSSCCLSFSMGKESKLSQHYRQGRAQHSRSKRNEEGVGNLHPTYFKWSFFFFSYSDWRTSHRFILKCSFEYYHLYNNNSFMGTYVYDRCYIYISELHNKQI